MNTRRMVRTLFDLRLRELAIERMNPDRSPNKNDWLKFRPNKYFEYRHCYLQAKGRFALQYSRVMTLDDLHTWAGMGN